MFQVYYFFIHVSRTLYFLKYILKVRSLVNKYVNEITVSKFIGVFLYFARGVGRRVGHFFVNSIKSCISCRYLEYWPFRQANPG